MISIVLFTLIYALMVSAFCGSNYEFQPLWEKNMFRILLTGAIPIIGIANTTPLSIIFIIVFVIYALADVVINSEFTNGLLIFMVGHITAVVYLVIKFGLIIHAPILAVLLTVLFGISYTKVKDKVPIFAYLFSICLVTSYALFTFPIIGVGYLVFMFSDLALARDRFLKPIQDIFVINSALYYLGIILIMVGVMFHNLNGGVML